MEQYEHTLAGIENHDNLEYAHSEHQDVAGFLANGDLRIPIHSSCIEDPANTLNIFSDVDGLFIELKSVKAILKGLHFLFLDTRPGLILNSHFGILRKHLDLTTYSPSGLVALKNSLGLVIAHVDGGYFLNLTAIPLDPLRPPHALGTKAGYVEAARPFFLEAFRAFQKKLLESAPEDLRRPTLLKQCLTSTAKFEVLFDDLEFVLSLLHEAIREVETAGGGVKLVTSLTRFGQKQRRDVDLSFLDRYWVKGMTAHLAVTIGAKNPETHFLWSRSGLREVFGTRVTEYTSLSLPECANVQTLLGTQSLDVRHSLLRALPQRPLRFVQAYSDAVHCKFSTSYYHPVSGAIVLCNLQHGNSQTSLYGQAQKYISRVSDCATKMVGQLCARLECVAYFDDVPHTLRARGHFDRLELEALLVEKPLLVPFVDDSCSLPQVLKGVLEHIHEGLATALQQNAGKGGYQASWKAFQLELAFEEMVFGHPFSPLDGQYSASLGTSTSREWSLTCQRGFLGLAPCNSAAVGNEPPAPRIWTANRLLQTRVWRLFPVTDCLEAAPVVVGAALVRVILGDLFARELTGIPYAILQGTSLPAGCKLLGGQSHQDLAVLVCQKANFGFPHTFSRAKQLVAEKGFDVTQCVLLGIAELALNYFPAIRLSDPSKHQVAWRIQNSFTRLHSTTDPPREAVIAGLVQQVCNEMERRGLTYSRNLERYKACGMPWLDHCIRRLPGTLTVPQRLVQLTFLSCIGLRMNGDFIEYEAWRRLTGELHLKQDQMQRLTVQSREILESLTAFRVYKLHAAIPYRLLQRLPPQGPRLGPRGGASHCRGRCGGGGRSFQQACSEGRATQVKEALDSH